MAASWSSSSDQPKHDVFLSFRGEDTRNTFTSYLYQALKRKGIGAYLDENQLEKGQQLSPVLLKAIEDSKICVIIFSENYASSSWCLQELFKIMELERANKQVVVVPIFYHVSPSDVRKLAGNFDKAFANHLQNWASKLQDWKAAFTEAGSVKGWHIVGGKSDRPEPEYIEKIVEDIIKKLAHMSQADCEGLVGIGFQKEQIKDLLCIDRKDIPMIEIGIWGMGGIGKTTLAQAIYDEVYGEFDSCCFLANVAEESRKSDGITSLRDKLLCTLLEDERLHTSTPKIGSSFINDRLRRKRVLIVLDDVTDFEQLEILALGPEHLGYGSRSIITSRDKQVLKIGAVDRIYEVKGLNHPHSLHLFSLYAFKKDQPLDDFRGLSDRVLEYAKGVPIALKVLGSTLYQKSKEQWESALNKLKKHPNPKIHSVLKISFDGLDEMERNLFLDIACFFKGKKTEDVARILTSCYEGVQFGISNLVDKCLVSITRADTTLWMHDLLQEMGWNIVRQEAKEPGECSRLWTPNDVSRVLKYDMGSKSVEGLFLDMCGVDEIQLHPDVFRKMHNLRFINFYYSMFSGNEGKSLVSDQDLTSLPGQLSYLHWEHCPLRSLPSNFSPEKLVELRLPHSNVERLWDNDQNLENLRVIDLRNCKYLTKVPDLSRARNLEQLEVSGCISLVDLPCMVHLQCLENLCLNDCPITVFPKIPRNLKSLNLSGTQIEEVPSSIKCFRELASFNMSHTRIRNLPDTVVKMESLRTICLSHCPNITHFPIVPENIQELILGYTQIEVVPSSIKCLGKLCILDMSGTRIENLPSTIVEMDLLRSINLCHCPNIIVFPNVPNNIEILLLDNTPIEEVPSSVTRLKCLSKLSMCECTRIKSLPASIAKLKSLQQLDLLGCSNLEIFPEIAATIQCLTELAFRQKTCIMLSPILNDHIIRMRCSKNLNILGLILSKGFREFRYLTAIDLNGSNIVTIPSSIRELPRLTSLSVKCCKRLRTLPILPPCLQKLNAHDCIALELVLNTRSLSNNPRLVHILFGNCFSLDPNVANSITASALLRLRCLVKEWVKECSRGVYEIIPANVFDAVVACSEISEGFEHRSLNSSITIKLCPDEQSDRFLCFAPCVVVDFKSNHENMSVGIVCEIRLKTKWGDDDDFISRWTLAMHYDDPIYLKSNNMIIWFDYNMIHRDKNYEEASFEFYTTSKDDGRRLIDLIKVEKCGVHVFYVDANSSSIDCNNEGNECNPNMIVQFQPNSPIHSDEDINFDNIGERLRSRRRSTSFDAEGEAEQKRLKF